MSSKAMSGKGTVLAIGATPTPIVEVKTFQFSGGKNDTEDVSNSDSPGLKREGRQAAARAPSQDRTASRYPPGKALKETVNDYLALHPPAPFSDDDCAGQAYVVFPSPFTAPEHRGTLGAVYSPRHHQLLTAYA